MLKKRVLVALLVTCLTITSCVGFAPQVWAADSDAGKTEVTETDIPAGPEMPSEPETPINPETPGEPSDPSEPGTPVDPETPEEPSDPETPVDPDTPVEPEQPEQILNAWDEDGYYHDENGEIVKNAYMLIGNKLYKFNKAGLCKFYTGVYESYYYNNGTKITKHKSTVKKMGNGKFYYFKKNGSVFKGTGWKRVNGKRYYIKNGTAYTGWHYIGKYKYYFHKKSATLCQDLIACQGSKWKKKDLYIKVNRTKNIVTIYAKDGKNGYTIPVKALTCSVGKKKSPTITGTYTLKSGSGLTYRWHTLGGPGISPYCYGQYCVRIHKSWLFHSVTYDKPDKMTLQTETYNDLGKAASHGCVRLQVKDAKLIYDIVKNRNTKVKIYDSSYAGPFDKPVIEKIPAGQKYDPTDSAVKK
jgi:hypothetical protein